MADRGNVPRLALEPGEEPGIGRELRAEHLDSDLPAEHLVPGPVDRRHVARAKLLEQRAPAAENSGAHDGHVTSHTAVCRYRNPVRGQSNLILTIAQRWR